MQEEWAKYRNPYEEQREKKSSKCMISWMAASAKSIAEGIKSTFTYMAVGTT